jgi:glycosyltransferase involved in cell wall biosynthesis
VKILCPTYWYPTDANDTHATYVHDINRHLVRRGHEVTVVTPGLPGTALRDAFDGVDVVRFPLSLPPDLTYGKVAQSRVNRRQKLGRLVAMVRYLHAQLRATVRAGRERGVDVVHAHWAIPTGPAATAAARTLGVPCFITLHGGDVYVNESQGYDFPTRPYVRPVLRWTLRSAQGLTAISEDCKHHALRAGARDADVHLIWNGADLRRFSPAPEGGEAAGFGRHMIFACRQLFPRKGIRFLVEAVARIADRFPEVELVLAGDGFERAELEELARRLGIAERTRFLGWVPNAELPRFYRSAAVSVIPSLEEGFGIPAAEAMGCEVPVVASDAGGLPEVVEDGVTGLVVPRGDVDALADALVRLLSDADLRRRMGREGRKRALRRFDWDHSAERFEALFREATGGGASRG